MKPRAEKVGEQGSVGEVCWHDGEVSVSRVFGNREIGVAGVEIDRLSTNEHQRVAVFDERIDGVEQRPARM